MEEFVNRVIPSILETVLRNKIGANSGLSPYEVALIYHYSESGYEDINENLIQNKGEITTEYEKLLVESLDKLPNFIGRVYRGVKLNANQKQYYFNAFAAEIPLNSYSFLSSSKKVTIANMYSSGDTIFEIISKTGKEIENFAKFGINSGQNEFEVLFLPNVKFDVLDIRKDNNLTYILLEEII